ncbi:DUF6882 domain-containing protein [Sphingomonas pokkalii]|uniref:Uncharacterized protein n=1 Tax=Sphingomonas pokkalii TaxID=2175090 RepID=A0A2U0S9X3_9SPHN|nr:DUF6882 domain-containing protein [Sphingomonas pokkalii]PVX28187.1 hypothetical protein DD559_01545 [Sphingomonas pokkalii]
MIGALAALLLFGSALAGDPRQRLLEPEAELFAKAEAEIVLKTAVFQRTVGRDYADWDLDLVQGVIRFIGRAHAYSAPVQVIGTYNMLDGTFLWGWDHPSVPVALGADARLARQFGKRNRLPLFTTRKVACTEQQAWQFTAVALYLSDAGGAYRARSGTTLVFVTFGALTLQADKR